MAGNVKSAIRTLKILELFASNNQPLSLRDITSILDLPKSSTYMLLNTLVEERYIEETHSKKFQLAGLIPSNRNWLDGWAGVIRRAALPEMDKLLQQFNESVVLGRLTSSMEVQIISARQSTSEMALQIGKKPIIPAWCSCMGHAMLAKLPKDQVARYLQHSSRKKITNQTATSVEEILEKLNQWQLCGYALNIDERINGASGIAVPILNINGQPIASLNIVMLSPQLHSQKDLMIKALKIAAKKVEKAIFIPTTKKSEETRSWHIG